MQKLLLITLISGAIAFSSIAQTGRIAHFSHGGSAATVVMNARVDNFGVVPTIFEADSARLLTKHKVVFYGKWMGSYLTSKQREARTETALIGEHGQWRSVQDIIETYKEYYRPFKLIGFDSAKVSGQARQPSSSRKTLKSSPKKASGQTHGLAKRPFQYSYWRELAGTAALSAVGWLLGKKRAA